MFNFKKYNRISWTVLEYEPDYPGLTALISAIQFYMKAVEAVYNNFGIEGITKMKPVYIDALANLMGLTLENKLHDIGNPELLDWFADIKRLLDYLRQ